MSWDLIARLLQEFNYEKNGPDATVCFLIEMLNQIVNGGESDED